ncbi:MAG: CarD family transcriptional regulator [Hyphomicrobiaceae bacterium]
MTKKTKLPPKTGAAKAVSLKSKSATKAPTKSPPASGTKAGSSNKAAATKAAPAKAALAKAAAPVKAKASVKPAAPALAATKPGANSVKPAVAKVAPVAKAAPVPSRAPQVTQQRAMPAEGAKQPAERLTANVPVKPAAKSAAPAAPASAASDPKKPITSRHGFKTSELIVYPAHGVGRIIGIEEQEIAGISLELFVIEFDKDKMTLRVPTSKLASVGMRKLAEDGVLKKAMDTLKGKARIKRTMWSRRAQEYEAKINSGDLVSIAEVVRDLYRSDAQPEQSYSERQLYEAALDRMSRELAAVDHSDERGAMQRITEVLAKSARGRRAAEEQTEPTESGEVKAA